MISYLVNYNLLFSFGTTFLCLATPLVPKHGRTDAT